MTTYIALLRAVNVGGTGKLAMADLCALCEAAGFTQVRTFIASGNLIFESALPEAEVKAELESALQRHCGRPVAAILRTGREMAEVLAANPFPTAEPKHTVAIFLDVPPAADALTGVKGRESEEMALGRREIYVHYGAGIGRSKLKIPAAKAGTARNMQTIAALAARASAGPAWKQDSRARSPCARLTSLQK